MTKILSTVSFNFDTNIVNTCLPLFRDESIDAIEWSFDTLYQIDALPSWFSELLFQFGDESRLIGHGVFFSLLNGVHSTHQKQWLKDLEEKSKQYKFNHITEHFGFFSGSNAHQGAPLSLPYTETTLKIGIDRLKRISNVCKCPVGLENLALAYSLEDVKRHGEFLEALVSPVNGFVLLDLHNLYCQVHNFEIPFDDIIQSYPLDLVREIHISGGSWSDSQAKLGLKIRRDTHDDFVPEQVFEYLEKALKLCPNLKYVVLEQVGNGLSTQIQQDGFQRDFCRMKRIISNYEIKEHNQLDFMPIDQFQINTPIENEGLYNFQRTLSSILENAENIEDAFHQISKLNKDNPNLELSFSEPHMLETAIRIAQKWRD